MDQSLLYRIALTMVPNIGAVFTRLLLEHVTPEEIFTAKRSTLEKISGLGPTRIKCIKNFRDFDRAEKEIAFIEKYNITPLCITDDNYPQRLLHCYDAPSLLYYKGSADLNTIRIIAIVGSRLHTEYGKFVCEKLVADLEGSGILVVSGLAFGVDSLAHKAALQANLQTVGVLAHGLDKIYPVEHTNMARDMIKQGGLLTEFISETRPDKHNFPSRNRIVAGMADATIVIETEIKGGSMITAELANGYNKDVFAFPGKAIDKKSSGCNALIKNAKANLLTDAQQLLEAMGWTEKKKINRNKTKELFIELTPEEKLVINILHKKEQAGIDEIHLRSGLSSSAVAVAILNLEMQNVIQSLPGKMYKVL